MPTSKRRKSAARKYVPKQPAAPVKKREWLVKLHSSHLMELRKNRDLLTMIKVGRAMNAIAYPMAGLKAYKGLKTYNDRRFFLRAGYELGGYLHEAINVVDRLKGPYLGEPAFEPLRLLVVDDKYRKFRQYARKVRNSVAFHLDDIDEFTSSIFERFEASNFDVMCGDDEGAADFYFVLSDYIDLQYLTEKTSRGNRLQETGSEMILGMMDYSGKFMNAAYTFQLDLIRKTLKGHVYLKG